MYKMSSIIRYDTEGKRLTAIIMKNGTVVELRNGANTYTINTGQTWESLVAWLTHYDIEQDRCVSVTKPELTEDSNMLINSIHRKGRCVNMRRKKQGDYAYNLKTYLFVKEGHELIPFYIAADGMMQYKYMKANTFAELDLIAPEFWIMDLGNQIVQCNPSD